MLSVLPTVDGGLLAPSLEMQAEMQPWRRSDALLWTGQQHNVFQPPKKIDISLSVRCI